MTAARPLLGKQILVTRPRGQSGKLQTALEALGAQVIAIPTIEIVPPDLYDALDAALSDTACYDWLVLTSANAVDAIASRLRFLKIPVEALVAFEIAAIGKSTADAVNALGLQVELIPPRAIAESLVEALLPLVQNRNKRVLIVRAKMARDILPEALRAAGVSVTIAEAYQSIIPTASVAELQQALTTGVDAITFTSASCVHNFVALVQKAGVHVPSAVKQISIGPITTQAMEEHQWTAAAEAASANIEGLAAAVVQSFQ